MNEKTINIVAKSENLTWFRACKVHDVPADGGVCVMYNEEQIAVYNFSSRNEWYATQNQCPHKMQMVLSRGIIGDSCGEPKVACPFHKKTFSLVTGENLNGEGYQIKTYPVEIRDSYVYVGIEDTSWMEQ